MPECVETAQLQFFQLKVHADVGLGVAVGVVGFRLLLAEDLGQILQLHVLPAVAINPLFSPLQMKTYVLLHTFQNMTQQEREKSNPYTRRRRSFQTERS